MENNQAKYAEAKANGYSDTEIAQHLGGVKYAEAIKEGHTDADIIKHFTGVTPETNKPSGLGDKLKEMGKQALEIEKQPGVPTSNMDKLKQVGSTFMDALKDPTPGSLITAPLRSAQQFGQQLGADVARKTGSRAAGFATQIASDPTTLVGGPEMPLIKSAFGVAGKVGNSALKTVMKIGANVSEASAEAGAKAGWKLPNVAAHEVEAAVGHVQTALKESTETAGKALNEAKANIGLPTTVEEKEASIAKNGNPFGIGKADMETGALTEYLKPAKTPEELVTTIKNFKETSAGLPKNAKAKVAQYLQDQIGNHVDWEKSGNQVEGVLKQQSKQLGNMIQEVLPKEVRGRMAKALELKDDLEKSLGLTETEGTGKAEQFLRSVFEGKSAKSKDYLKRLADLETFTGHPVLQELFKKFAGQDLHKLAGRPFLAATAAGAAPFHPAAAGILVAQSPRALNAIGKLAGKASGTAQVGSTVAARAARGFLMSEDKNKGRLDEVLKRLKHAS